MKVTCTISILLLIFSCNSLAKDDNTIDIGFITMLTGPGKVYGQVAANSAQLAVTEINKQGIHGKKLKLHVRDTKTSPATALSITKNLIEEDIDLIVGFHTSDERFAVKDYIESQQRLYLYTAIYEGRDWGKWTFFSGPVPNQIYDTSIEYLVHRHAIQTVYLVGSDYSYAHTSHDVLKKLLKKYQLTLIGEKFYPFPTTQFDVSDIVAKRPDLIVTNIVGEDDLLWALELQKYPALMAHAKLFSGLLQDPLLRIIKPEYIENFYSAYPFSKDSKASNAKTFVANYESQFGEEFGSVGQGVYDSLLLLAEGLKSSQGNTSAAVLSEALIGTEVMGTRGNNVMQSNHHVTMDVYLVRGNNDRTYKIVNRFSDVAPQPEL